MFRAKYQTIGSFLILKFLVLLGVLFPTCAGGQNQKQIPIGHLVSVSEPPEARTAFLFAISRHNEARKNTKELTFDIVSEAVDVQSNFDVTLKMCGQMKSGIFALYGSTSHQSYATCQAYSNKFHIPYITPSFVGVYPATEHPQMIFAKPGYVDAIADLIKYFGWRRLDYVYDNHEGLLRVQNIYDKLKRERYRVEIGFRRIENVEDAHEDFRRLGTSGGLAEETAGMMGGIPERENDERNIVIDASTEGAYRALLRQIPEVGMNRQGYNYILGTLDMTTLDFARFRHGGVNVTGFQAVDPTDPGVAAFLEEWAALQPQVWPGAGTRHLQTDAALAVDMLKTMSIALEDMVAREPDVFQYTFRRGKIYNMNITEGIQCNAKPVLPWMHGQQIYDTLKKVNFDGLTGHVQFDDRGQRTNYTLDIISVTMDVGLSKIGRWHSKYGVIANDEAPYGTDPYDQQNYTDMWSIVVTTLLEPPFLMLRKDEPNGDDQEYVSENDKYEGYTKDLAEEIGKRLRLSYHLRLAPDGEHGRELPNKTWTGMVGDLVYGAADMAIGPLTITAARERVIDFSKSFMDIGISIMIRRPEKQKPGLFSFMEPFSVSLWVSILLAYIVISLTVFIVSRFSPYQPKSRRRRWNDDFKHNFTLCNSFWFAMGALMMQGSVLCPRSIAGRIIGGVWWFFVLIVISSYTANLAAFLTIERMIQPVESADDLAHQTDIAYGMLETGTTRGFFETSNVTTYRMMWNYMSTASPSVMVKTVEEGVKRVQDSGGKFAFLLESSTNDYYNNRKPCNTIKVGPNLNLNSFGIATPHGSQLKDKINYVSLKLKEDGTLHRLKQRWWEEKGGCGVDTGNKESKKRSLSLSNVAGVFLLLIGGLVLAIGVGLIEARYNKRHYGSSVFISESSSGDHSYLNGHVINKCNRS
ncbi:hypothetical protein RRG08_000972 [Elysia crispata]|uniref:Glutamate receptor n=1 Tax=Elysia crispata TaxID=231223 RepID=A0AAE1DXX1_9GAST|nr:hypothetical protein RRG08_000972 [Elysia crispata]